MFKRHPAGGHRDDAGPGSPELCSTSRWTYSSDTVPPTGGPWTCGCLDPGATCCPANVHVSSSLTRRLSPSQLRADDKGRVFTALGSPIVNHVEFSFESGRAGA
jgi:hypothetical protein